MAINLDERYPGRANGKTLSYPQGSFKNRTSPTSKDGTYLEQDWANDWAGFFQRMMVVSGISPNGAVDTAESSQYFDALSKIISDATPDASTTKKGLVELATTAQAQSLTDDATVITPKKLGDAMNANVAMLAGGAAANFANMIRVSGKDVIATGSNANGFWMEFSIGIIFQMSIGFELTYQSSDLLMAQWAFPRQATGEFGIFYSAADLTTKGTNSSVLSPVSTNATTNAGAQVVVRSQGASNRFSSGERIGVTCLFMGVV